MNITLQDYTNKIADYIDDEYEGGSKQLGMLTDDEKWTIRNMVVMHHECNDSINNVANYIMNYMIESRSFMNDLTEGE
jgi:hypothetical protein